jgi:hypothetical protein
MQKAIRFGEVIAEPKKLIRIIKKQFKEQKQKKETE